jgi:hypothetical protein
MRIAAIRPFDRIAHPGVASAKETLDFPHLGFQAVGIARGVRRGRRNGPRSYNSPPARAPLDPVNSPSVVSCSEAGVGKDCVAIWLFSTASVCR